MADPKVGRVAFGPSGESSEPTGHILTERYHVGIPAAPPLSSRFVPEFIPAVHPISERVRSFDSTADELSDLINLAIRVGRGTATIKELTEALAPFGVRRKV